MNKEKRYQLRRKRYKNFFLFYIGIVILVFSHYTFSRYTETVTSKPTLTIAKFNVMVNGTTIGDSDVFNLSLAPITEGTNTNAYNNKLVPNSERRFDIEIDPTGTEVSLEYQFTFNLNNPKIKLTKYSLDGGKTFKDDMVDNVIKGEILLQDENRAFKESEKVTISAYLEWKESEDIVNPEPSESNITVQSIISQKIN